MAPTNKPLSFSRYKRLIASFDKLRIEDEQKRSRAKPWSKSKTYKVGDYVLVDGKLCVILK